MKIEMSLPMMAKLIDQGVLTPSDVRCLDEASKLELKKLCLDSCKPNECALCDAQDYCAHNLSQPRKTPFDSVEHIVSFELS